MAKYCVCKGQQFSWPRIIQIRKNRESLDISVYFTSDFIYHLIENGQKDPDQDDWIKLDGLYFFDNIFKSLNTRYVSAMLVGRYNEVNKTIEVNHYFHDGSSTPIYDNSNKLVIPFPQDNIYYPGIRYSLRIDYRRNDITSNIDFIEGDMIIKGNTIIRDFNTRIPKYSNRINFYFGGNEKAPSKVCIHKY